MQLKDYSVWHNFSITIAICKTNKFVPVKLRKKWENLNLHYMSEEEDGDDGKICVKKLPWRSGSKTPLCLLLIPYYHPHFCLELNELIVKLDALASDAAKTQNNFIPERKERIVATIPSSQPPPSNAPEWALKPQWRNGGMYCF